MIKFLSDHLPHITEVGAIAAARIVGLGCTKKADLAAIEAITKAFNEIDFNGRIVIGRGEKDIAPELYVGQKIGSGSGHQVDIAIDPLENTNATANFNNNAVSVLAASEKGGLFHAPDMYMDKLIVGAEAAGKVFLDAKPLENLKALAEALKRDIRDLVVVILDRERNKDLIAQVREAGARVKLVVDGDLMPGVAVCLRGSGVHAVMGIGTAPEGVLTSAAIRCLKGQFQGRFWPKNLAEEERLKKIGGDPKKIYTQNDLASGENIVFCATGVTTSDLLDGVRFFGGGAKTQTLSMANQLNEISFFTKIHILDKDEIEFRI